MDEIVHELVLVPVKKLFYKDNFGVYACETEDLSADIELNRYGNFVINGEMPELIIGQKYQVSLTESMSERYGKGYRIVSIYQELPKTVADQHVFLREILAPSYAEAIISVYPDDDIITMFKENTLDWKRVKGIGEKTYQRIRKKIVENIEIHEALIELSKYDITYKIIEKIISHFKCSPALAVQRIKENPYILCEVSGLGFMKVDGYARKMGVSIDSPERIYAAIEFVMNKQGSDGHTWVTISEIIKETNELTKVSAEKIKECIENAPEKRFFTDESRIAISKNHYYEVQIAEHLYRLAKSENILEVKNVEEKIKKAEEEAGFQYTEEQKQAVYKAIENNVLVISGRAGTGKSTILKLIMTVLGKYNYGACAFSGKAAQRITESTGLEASTIHRMLAYNPHDGFVYNRHNQLPFRVIDLDEGSMVPLYLFYHMITAIKDGTKLIILGDIEQLPPIGAGNVMKDIMESGVIPVVELTEVHRQALKSGILLAANHVREGKQITDRFANEAKVIGELKDLYLIPKDETEEIYEYLQKLCEKRKEQFDLMDFQVISPVKTRGALATKNLNVMLQEIFNPGEKPKIRRNGYDFKVGDKVIQSGNDYEKGVFNGTLGRIVNIDEEEKTAEIQFVGFEHTIIYSDTDMSNIDMAYALTVHRVQGSQFKDIVFVLDYSAYVLLSKQLVYTALTRAKLRCVFIFQNKALRYAISKNHSSERNTFLVELLRKMFENDGIGEGDDIEKDRIHSDPQEHSQKSQA